MAAALRRLNPMQRAAIVLRHVDGLSVPEVAK
ncbi:MAG: sigma factor-like helix-turn-helix DNA-binding protein [Acidimicrobiales bacterium]